MVSLADIARRPALLRDPDVCFRLRPTSLKNIHCPIPRFSSSQRPWQRPAGRRERALLPPLLMSIFADGAWEGRYSQCFQRYYAQLRSHEDTARTTCPSRRLLQCRLYGERHGFVQNYMYDEKHDDFFTMAPNPNASNPHWWNHAEPVWVTAEKNGLRTAMYWWDGCQVEIRGVKPTKCIQYRDYWQWPTVENDTKAALSEIVDNFKQNKLDFALVYYEAVDAEGHGSGPDSMERRRALKSADNVIKHLLDEAKRQNIRDQLSLIVVSDHGMTDTTEGKFELIDIEPHIDANDIHSMLDGGSFAMLRPHPDKIEKIYAKLKSLNIKGLNVFKREELPELYHLKETYLTQPIVLTADPGYQIKKLQGTDKQVPQSSRIYKGNHGYDPMKLEDMRAIFLATGPGLKQGFQGGPVRMVDHYNVICRQLGIQPLENSGSQDSVRDMFTGGASGSAAASLSLLLVPNILLAARGYLYH
ncbi:glycerophosphocholine cholinephosphodiesterase ENPP6-like isoform X1 [Dermacentor albipictus]|uniref:glycerophosphocholine cholinephosphodiesterase ENPP6-like isoform X1 n=1 Tax=Dermacentor albipictus TaxID=60249 RepID=UPI0031FC3456